MSARGWAVAVAALVGTVVLAVPGSASAAAPWVHVTPNSGLRQGSVVTITTHALPPNTSVNLAECDVPRSTFIGCPPLITAVTDARGDLRVDVAVQSYVYRSEEFGDSPPVYCRADQCRIYAEWIDSHGDLQLVQTNRMHFVGSPATIAAQPTTGLADRARVRVTGTAKGTSGRYVTIVEEYCRNPTGGHFCGGSIPLATVPVDAKDGYAATVTVYRTLADGVDCAWDGDLGACLLSVIVLDSSGRPDGTFGLPDWGDPGVGITFAGP